MNEKRHRLYTILLEFESTTSVSQFRAASSTEALELWSRHLGDGHRYGLSPVQAQSIASDWDAQFSACPLNDVLGVWCHTVLAGASLALFNVVATADEAI